ncbi:MAG: hypothetical protein Kow0092_27300 [Deferrisomatales bacterium]
MAAGAAAGNIPRSARLLKDAGNQFLAAKKYADSIDCYFQALELCPDFPEAHYNLGVAFLKGYKALALALHHFEQYLGLRPDARDAEAVRALIGALRERVPPLPDSRGEVLGVVAGRLWVSGSDWAQPGDRIEIAEKGKAPRAELYAGYVYPDGVLTQRIRDQETLDGLKPGLVAVNASQRILPR